MAKQTITKDIKKNGRIVLPFEFRSLNAPLTKVEITYDEKSVRIRPVKEEKDDG